MKSNKSLPTGGLPELISPYLQKLIKETGGETGPIGKQFIAQPEKEYFEFEKENSDPLIEQYNEILPGVIYKYRGKVNENGEVEQYGRLLWTISRFCATYCRFCFRGRVVGLPANESKKIGETIAQRPYLTTDDVDSVISFIRKNKEVNEVILSGGDPFIAPHPYLMNIFANLEKLQEENNLDFIRIHTRAPITNPFSVQPWHYELIRMIRHPHIVLHINHPAEITNEVQEVITKLQESGAHLKSQSVMLKGINDNVETLSELFIKLTKIGIQPYYLHQNDPVPWAKHFTVPLPEAIVLWQQLRPRLSGIAATARFVIDTPEGYGKVAIPEGAWNVDFSHFTDFRGTKHSLISSQNKVSQQK